MYRKKDLQGCCLCCFALGLLLGHRLDSWLICCCGGVGLLLLVFCVLRRR